MDTSKFVSLHAQEKQSPVSRIIFPVVVLLLLNFNFPFVASAQTATHPSASGWVVISVSDYRALHARA